MEKELQHSRKLDILENNPQLLKLQDIVLSTKEAKLYSENGRLIAEPDLMFLDKHNNLNVIEYKLNNNKNKAIGQLHTARDHLNKYFGCAPQLYYVHEDYQFERVD